ncbi:MAG: hypothetical protein O2944_10700 [Proteobacteria bacterium]|nr:hypothetical protein [Pseudomonadota bacterium]
MSGQGLGMRPHGWSFALVLFDGGCSLPYLQLLKPGYRHCLAIVQTADGWVLFNPLSNSTEIVTLPKLRPDRLIRAFKDDGLDVVAVQRRRPIAREHPWIPYSCVEAVKRLIGVRERSVLTPWQLRRRLAQWSMRHRLH